VCVCVCVCVCVRVKGRRSNTSSRCQMGHGDTWNPSYQLGQIHQKDQSQPAGCDGIEETKCSLLTQPAAGQDVARHV
jgi:alkylation response protein AidB-like acyl-CoA dehydrogenase